MEAIMPQPLTEIERRVLDYLVAYLRTNTYQPSIREIGFRFEIKSTKTVSELLQSLADKGWIERDPSRSRGVRLLGIEMHPDTVTVPWYGRKEPSVTGRDAVVEAFELDRKLAGDSGTFIVAMPDDGLTGEGIRAADLLLVDPVVEESLEDGDLVVVRVAGERTVKRYRRRGGDVALESSAPGVLALGVRLEDGYEVEGRVISVVRRLRTPRASGASLHAPTEAG
jgi:repressor LexA